MTVAKYECNKIKATLLFFITRLNWILAQKSMHVHSSAGILRRKKNANYRKRRGSRKLMYNMVRLHAISMGSKMRSTGNVYCLVSPMCTGLQLSAQSTLHTDNTHTRTHRLSAFVYIFASSSECVCACTVHMVMYNVSTIWRMSAAVSAQAFEHRLHRIRILSELDSGFNQSYITCVSASIVIRKQTGKSAILFFSFT